MPFLQVLLTMKSVWTFGAVLKVLKGNLSRMGSSFLCPSLKCQGSLGQGPQPTCLSILLILQSSVPIFLLINLLIPGLLDIGLPNSICTKQH